MFYEISNVVFNHKPTEWEITHRNPFYPTKKNKVEKDYYLVEDTPQNLFKMFQLGHCIKPHAPSNPRLAIAHTIVLDFDNLTKGQCEFVKFIVNGLYGFKDGMCGDYSAGTKARLHENKDIPNYEPPKWGYKVFYPIERVVMKMGRHIADSDCGELTAYFTSVIDWIDGTFKGVSDEMCGLEWGDLYERFHANAYNADKVWRRVEELLGDDCVTAKRGVFEYVLGGEADTRLLNVRVFDRKTAKAVYAKQTEDARGRGVSNCPLCAVGHEANKTRIWAFDEMDADHVSAWSRGGATDISNCQMLCKTHNRAKGNR